MRIESLEPGEIFVFGSNANGAHGAGAAAMAVERFGAVWGQGDGLQGQSYGIDTMSGLRRSCGTASRASSTSPRGIPNCASSSPRSAAASRATRPDQVAPLFEGAPANVVLPERFRPAPDRPLALSRERVVLAAVDLVHARARASPGSSTIGRSSMKSRMTCASSLGMAEVDGVRRALEHDDQHVVLVLRRDLLDARAGPGSSGSRVPSTTSVGIFSSSRRCSEGYCVSARNILNVLGTPKRR